MDVTNTIGYIAAALTTVSFLPQVVHTVRSKSSKDLSMGMIVLFMLGISAWLIYGLILKQLPIILANSVTLVLTIVLFIAAIAYRK